MAHKFKILTYYLHSIPSDTTYVENFMQNVGKRISYKEKKRILSLDTIHESIDSGSGARGGKEKKAPIDCQNMSLTRNPEKKIALLAPSDSQAYFPW